MMKTSRRGMTVLELIAASALLAMLLTICLQMTGAAAAERRAVRQRQAAVIELANVLERLGVRPWSQLTEQQARREPLSPAAAAMLPKAELLVEVAAAPVAPDAKRITVSLRWQGRGGVPRPAVSLSAWRYRLIETAGTALDANAPGQTSPPQPSTPR